VAALTDETYRREFYADTEDQLRLAFAVRLQYLAGITRLDVRPST
jgi:hypothetical protein